MKSNPIPNYKQFSKEFESAKVEEAIGISSKKLQKATNDFHEAQLQLQKLQKEFLSIPKDDAKKREHTKQQLIAQNKIVKDKEAIFSRALGEEDIEDLEI
jgi:hypothetical protein